MCSAHSITQHVGIGEHTLDQHRNVLSYQQESADKAGLEGRWINISYYNK